MKNVKKFYWLLTAVLILTGGFAAYQTALAVGGQGTATINGAANVTVLQATSHKFTVVLSIGASGITADAQNPTFTIPAGFTAPDAAPVANAGLVVADGDWSVTAAGGICTVENPTAGLTVAVGQLITVDVTTTCTVAVPDTITLTYQGQSATAMAATALVIKTADDIGWGAVTAIPASPTITVTGTASLTVTKTVVNDSGGSKIVSNFFLFIDGASVTSGVASTTLAGLHTVSETADAGYASVIGGDCAANGTITLAASDVKTCTITNNDIITATASGGGVGGKQQATINVVKVVINDNGRNKTIANFPLFVNNVLVVSGVTNVFPAPADAYIVSETNDANYTRTFSGDCDSTGRIGLSPGESKFCIITNNDIGAPIVVPLVPPLIEVIKTANPLALPTGPGPVEYTYTLRNIGTVPVTDITMIGDTCSPIILVAGDSNGDAKLDLNETWVHRCSTTLTETHTNTVVATGWANGISAVDIASATVVVGVPIVPPLIHVTKIPSPLALAAGGGMVTYTKKITNPGLVPLTNVHINDDKCGPVEYISGDTNKDAKLDTTEAWTFTCRVKLTKTTVNTAFAEGEANGLIARDFAIATVVVADAVPLVPKLPNAGITPSANSSAVSIAIFSGSWALVLGLLVIWRKRAI